MKAIIFDFDGVIHNTLEIGYNANKMLRPEMDITNYKDLFNGNLYENKDISSEKSELFFKFAAPEYAKIELREHIKDELLRLKEKYLLFIISSCSEKILHRYFERSSASHIFTDILGVETHTSKIEKFKILFNKYDLSKTNCLFVTDTLGDILEANKVGVDTIAVDFGFHERERLLKGNPIKIVSHFNDISNAIEDISSYRIK